MPEDLLQPNPFRWTESDAYLFDIDGTLLNTRDLVHWNALNRAMLEVYGVRYHDCGHQLPRQDRSWAFFGLHWSGQEFPTARSNKSCPMRLML